MKDVILIANAGSSSLKISVFEIKDKKIKDNGHTSTVDDLPPNNHKVMQLWKFLTKVIVMSYVISDGSRNGCIMLCIASRMVHHAPRQSNGDDRSSGT